MYTTTAKPLRLKLSTETQNPKKVHANTLSPVKSAIKLHYALRLAGPSGRAV